MVWQVHWAEDDSDGHPVLVVHLEAVLKQDRVAAERGAEAILAHMEAALASRLSDAPGCPEQLVVVLDSRGAPTIQVHTSAFPSDSVQRYGAQDFCLLRGWNGIWNHIAFLRTCCQTPQEALLGMVCSFGGWCEPFRTSL